MSPHTPRTPSLEAVRANLVAHLRLQRTEWQQAVVTYVSSATPHPLGERDAQFVFGEREVVSACLDCALAAIEFDGQWPGPIPPAVLVQERRAAHQGIGVTARLDRYLAAYQQAWDFVLAAAREIDIPSGHNTIFLRDVSMSASTLLMHLLREVVEVHLGELAKGGQTRSQRVAETVVKLLAGEPVDARLLDYDLDSEHLGVIAVGAGIERHLELIAQRLGCRLLVAGQPDGTVWAWLGSRRGLTALEIARRLSKGGRHAAVIGRPSVGLAGFRQTHRLAQAALWAARRMTQPITLYDEVELVAQALCDETCASSMVETYVKPLDRDRQGAELRQTLKALFQAGLNEGKAARLLGRHRHTVERRVEKIGRLIGRPVYECHAALAVALALAELLQYPDRHPESPWP